MSKAEKIIFALLFFPAPILFCMLIAAVSIFLCDIRDPAAGYLGLSSVAVGVLIDIVFLKRWVHNAYEFGSIALGFVYVFYSIIAWGMGMGVPLFNFAVGTAAGVFIAFKVNKSSYRDEPKHKINACAFFTAAVLVCMCCLSGFWALIGGLVGSQFELGAIRFTFTMVNIITLTLAGGVFLAVLQYWLTKAAAAITLRFTHRH